MIQWIIVALLIAACLLWIINRLCRRKKNGCDGCENCCGCESCRGVKKEK